jgi:predicted nucleic acid-binding protein
VGLSVLDSSVIIAFRDATDAYHFAAVAEIRRATSVNRLVVPVVAYADVLVGAYRARKGKQAESFFERAATVEALTPAIARRGANLRAQHGLPLPDSLIIATGIELDADEILTAEDRWRRIDRRVRALTS